MTNLLSIDPSISALGWAFFKNGKYKKSGVIKTDSKGGKVSKEERIEKIRKSIEIIIELNKINEVAIEDYGYGCQGNAIYTLGELGGVIRNLFHRMKIPINVVNISKIKLFVTGKGNCKKDLMLLKAYKKFGMEFEDDNECDAFCAGKCYLTQKEKGDKK